MVTKRMDLEKLEKIRKAGHNTYSYNYDKTHGIHDIIKKGDKNIGNKVKVKQVVSAAKDYGVPIRIGVNAGSLDKRLQKKSFLRNK